MTTIENNEQENKEKRQNTNILVLDSIGDVISDATRAIGEGLEQIEECLENFIEKSDPEFINLESVKKVVEDSAEKIAEEVAEAVEGVSNSL